MEGDGVGEGVDVEGQISVEMRERDGEVVSFLSFPFFRGGFQCKYLNI